MDDSSLFYHIILEDLIENISNQWYFSTEDIEELMEDTAEAVEKQREIDALISGQLTQVRDSHYNLTR